MSYANKRWDPVALKSGFHQFGLSVSYIELVPGWCTSAPTMSRWFWFDSDPYFVHTPRYKVKYQGLSSGWFLPIYRSCPETCYYSWALLRLCSHSLLLTIWCCYTSLPQSVPVARKCGFIDWMFRISMCKTSIWASCLLTPSIPSPCLLLAQPALPILLVNNRLPCSRLTPIINDDIDRFCSLQHTDFCSIHWQSFLARLQQSLQAPIRRTIPGNSALICLHIEP